MNRFKNGLLWAAVVSGLTACGGGGNPGDLTIDFHYSAESSATLWEEKSYPATLHGLDGNDQDCKVVGGKLPQGMSVDGNCTVRGTPLESGDFYATIRLEVEHYDGHIDTPIYFTVGAPKATYSFEFGNTWMVGVAHDELPQVDYFTQRPTDTVVYSATGLPKGMAVDAETGRLYGTPTESGDFQISIAFKVERDGRIVESVSNGSIYVQA